MRINDILIENKQVTEAPLGMLSKLGHGVKSAFGSGKSSGVLSTGNAANKLKQDYMKMLGSTGQEAEPDNLIAFLQKAGYPTDRVKSSFGGGAEPVEPTMDPAAAPARPQGGGKVAGQQSQTPGAVKKRAARGSTTTAPSNAGGAGAFDQMAKQVTQPKEPAQQATAAVKGTTAPAATTNAPTEPQAQPTSTKSQALGPKGRETLARLGKQKQTREKPKQGALDLNSRQYTGNSIAEALSDQEIDSAFLMAAQDKAKSGGATKPAGGNSNLGSGTSSGSNSFGSSGKSSISLSGIDIRTLKTALTSVINDRPVDNSSKQEIQKLLKQI